VVGLPSWSRRDNLRSLDGRTCSYDALRFARESAFGEHAATTDRSTQWEQSAGWSCLPSIVRTARGLARVREGGQGRRKAGHTDIQPGHPYPCVRWSDSRSCRSRSLIRSTPPRDRGPGAQHYSQLTGQPESQLLKGSQAHVEPRGGLRVHNSQTKKKKLHGPSPRANYTDRATTACRRSDCRLVRIEGATWSA
jgi:hypothetical protein